MPRPPKSTLFPYTTLFRSTRKRYECDCHNEGRRKACTVRSGTRSRTAVGPSCRFQFVPRPLRSEEHTSELQSHSELVCRLLLEKKKSHAQLPTCHPRRGGD